MQPRGLTTLALHTVRPLRHFLLQKVMGHVVAQPKHLCKLLICISCLFSAAVSYGAPAGFEVNSKATIFFTINGVNDVIESSPQGNTTSGLSNGAFTRFVIDKALSSTVTSAQGDASLLANAIKVLPGETAAIGTFQVRNNGNATQDFLLTARNTSLTVAGTQDANLSAPLRVFVESDRAAALPSYNNITDTEVFINDLAAGESLTVYVLADIPASASENDLYAVSLTTQVADESYSANPNDISTVILRDDDGFISAEGVFSNTAVSTVGSVPAASTAALDIPCNAANDASQPCSVQAIFTEGPATLAAENLDASGSSDIARNGQSADTMTFLAISSPITITKSQQVINGITSGPNAGQPASGSIVQYQLSVNAFCRTSAISNVVIRDIIPTFSQYQAGSLRVGSNGNLAAPTNSDFTQAGGGGFDSANNQIVVNLGNIPAPASASCSSNSQPVTIPSFPSVSTNTFLITFNVLIN